jgi:hypothetical protein
MMNVRTSRIHTGDFTQEPVSSHGLAKKSAARLDRILVTQNLVPYVMKPSTLCASKLVRLVRSTTRGWLALLTLHFAHCPWLSITSMNWYNFMIVFCTKKIDKIKGTVKL